jgi:putative sterol carrier protein
MTAQEIFDGIARDFDPKNAQGLSGTLQFELSGDGGGEWYVKVKDGGVEVARGTAESPNLTVQAAASDYVDIATGKMNPQMAFMGGKLKLKGDLGLAMKLQGLFKPVGS